MFDIEDKLKYVLDPDRRWMLSATALHALMEDEDADIYIEDIDIDEELHRVAHMLKTRKWEVVGSGNYSIVLQHPDMPDKVLKLVIKDDVSPKWVKYCAKRQGQPFVPVIHTYGEVLGFFFVILDKLILDQRRANVYVEIARAVRDGINTGTYDRDMFECPDFIKLVEDAYEMGKLDIHHDNIMFHPNTHKMFLIDPVM